MLNSIIQLPLTLGTLLTILLTAVALGILTAIVFLFRTRHSSGFALTLALLPVAVALIILLVNGNMGTGIAVAGAFSLVRFRSVPGTGLEIAALFCAMVMGLALGMGYVAAAVIFFVIVAVFMLSMTLLRFGAAAPRERTLRITIPENLDYNHLLDDVFKEYQIHAEMEKVQPNVTVPYIRFYVDDVDCPKGVGNRSIYVAYFIPQEEYDALKDSEYSKVYGVNLKSEVFSPVELGYHDGKTAGAGYRFPFMGCTRNGNFVSRIKAFPLPEKSEYEETETFNMALYLDPKQDKVKFGILDYGNMDSIQVQCAGLLLNSIDGKSPDVLETEFDLNSFDKNDFKVDSAFTYLEVPSYKVDPGVIEITRYAQKKPTSDKKVVANDLKVSSVQGGIIVTSEEPTEVSVVNVSGVLVNNSAVEGSAFISLPSGLYIVKNNNGKSSKVLVK